MAPEYRAQRRRRSPHHPLVRAARLPSLSLSADRLPETLTQRSCGPSNPHGLLTLLVTERRRELGVRMALGAAPVELVRLVVVGAGRLVAIGMVTGLGLTLVAGHLLRTMLFGVAPYDLRALAWSAAALTLVALAAIVIPARQASRASAMDAMRTL